MKPKLFSQKSGFCCFGNFFSHVELFLSDSDHLASIYFQVPFFFLNFSTRDRGQEDGCMAQTIASNPKSRVHISSLLTWANASSTFVVNCPVLNSVFAENLPLMKFKDRALGSSGLSSWLWRQRSWVRSPAMTKWLSAFFLLLRTPPCALSLSLSLSLSLNGVMDRSITCGVRRHGFESQFYLNDFAHLGHKVVEK